MASRSDGDGYGDSSLEVGAAVWVPCPDEVWRSAVVSEMISAGSCQVEIKGERGRKERLVVSLRPQKPSDPPTFLARNQELMTTSGCTAAQDLSQLTLLHEAAILQALQVRFKEGIVYTLTGPVLLAVNPFRQIPDLYSEEKLRLFAELKADEPCPVPHVYGVGRAAYEGVHRKGASQTVLVSGESGAGKTETTKFVIRFLALTAAGCAEDGMTSIERRVIESIPLLEALGNAKTLRNDNSSRFGKYIEVQFSRQPGSFGGPRLLGAKTHTYLLEKVRVVKQQEGERSFHIFYQVLAAAAAGPISFDGVPLLGVSGKQPSDFSFLSGSSARSLPGHDESADFSSTLSALRSFGVPDDKIAEILGAVVAVLYLGNITFNAPANNSEGSEIAGRDQANAAAAMASTLLGVEATDLEAALCRQNRAVKDEGREYKISQPRTIAQANECRDALARHLYGAVFTFVVTKINDVLGAGQDSANGVNRSSALPFVGVLDIFGFEFFKVNSFEQLCINYTNELLQQYFNEVIFEYEEMLYTQEGIAWNPQDFPDNKAIVTLLRGDSRDKLSGALPMLDEECQLNGGNAESWVRKMGVRYGATSKLFSQVKIRPGCFVIQHFAGPVEYESKAFLNKNRDTLSPDALECMKTSSKDFIRERFLQHSREFGAKTTVSGRVTRAKAYSVSSEFREQLQTLMESIRATVPHFVRCIKPNPKNLPNEFHRMSVVEQLRYQGVLQAIEVSRAGYPTRLRHREAVFSFRQLAEKSLRRRLELELGRHAFAQAAMLLFAGLQESLPGLAQMSRDKLQVGATLVFFKREATEVLDNAMRRKRAAAALQLQTAWRGIVVRRWYAAVCAAALRLQAELRRLEARLIADRMRQELAALRLQSSWRCRVARERAQKLRHASLVITSILRCRLQQFYFQRVTKSVSVIQRWFRSAIAGWRAKRRHFAALALQSRWRQVLGLRMAKKWRQAKIRRDTMAQRLSRRWRYKMLLKVRDMAAQDRLDSVMPGELVAAMECLRRLNGALGYAALSLERSSMQLEAEIEREESTGLGRLLFKPFMVCCTTRENYGSHVYESPRGSDLGVPDSPNANSPAIGTST